MVDTVKLLIPQGKLKTVEGTSWDLHSKTEQFKKFVRNPSKAQKDTGKYFPRLTGYSRRFGCDANVLIEFSVPKLIFSNNLEELSDDDFPAVVTNLKSRLEDMGILVTKSVIEDAHVSSVHYSRNITLEDGYTTNYIISELGKIDLRKTFDLSRVKFTNDGQSLHAHSKAHELVIYDKVADLSKTKKRAVDKDQTITQKSLFEYLSDDSIKEILRIEIRLCQKQKMNQVLNKLGFDKNPAFKEVYCEEKSKAVTLYYWNELIVSRNRGLLSVEQNTKDILQIMFLTDRDLSPKRAIYLLGLYVLARDENGIRQLRSMVSKKMHERSWYRMSNDLKYAQELITDHNLRDWVKQINSKLENYEPYKIRKNKERKGADHK